MRSRFVGRPVRKPRFSTAPGAFRYPAFRRVWVSGVLISLGRLDGTAGRGMADSDRDRVGVPHRGVVRGPAGAGTDRGADSRGDQRPGAAQPAARDRGRVPGGAAGAAGVVRPVGTGTAVGRLRADRAGRRRARVRDPVHPGTRDRRRSAPRRNECGRAAVGRRPRNGRVGRAGRRRRDRQLRHPRRPVRRRGRISGRRTGWWGRCAPSRRVEHAPSAATPRY